MSDPELSATRSAKPGSAPGSSLEAADPARALLDAVTAISSDLDLHSVLTRIIVSATELTGARYGALGVIGGKDNAAMVNFITTGVDPRTQELIGEQPMGRGILRLLIDEPETIRLDDLTAHPQAFGFPPNHPPMRSFLGVPIRIRGTVFGNLYLTQKSGAVAFTEEDERLVQALATAAGLVIDNARAYGLSERRRQWLEAAATLIELLQPPVDLARALEHIASAARSVSGSSAAAVISLPTDGEPQIVALDGPAVRLERPLLDAIATESITRGGAAEPFEVPLGRDVAVVIPLRAHLAERGGLVAVYDAGYRFDNVEESGLLASFADQAALALDRTQALIEREELALISDRDRIARDLHDLVIQRLFATGLQLQAVIATPDRADMIARIGQTVEDLDLTIKDIRGTIFDLENRDSTSLRAEVRDLVKEYVSILGFTPTVRTTGPLDSAVPATLRADVLAVLREAVSNLARHSGAKHADVEVQVSASGIRVSVLDDGGGLPGDRRESGLRNARRRAHSHGGTFELTGRVPCGTSFVWSIPLS